MRNKLFSKQFIFCFIVVLISILNLFILFNKRWIKLNDEVIVNGYNIGYDYEYAKELINEKYYFDEPEIDDVIRNSEYEKKMKDFSISFVEELFNNELSALDFMNKYFVRNYLEPFSIYYNPLIVNSLKKDSYQVLYKLKNNLISSNSSYDLIDKVKLVYLNNNNYSAVVFLKGVNGLYNGDYVIQFKIINEKSSEKLKVEKLLIYESSQLSNISKINRFLDFGEDKVTDAKLLEYQKKYSDSIVRIKVYDDEKRKIDEVTGFFVKPGVIITVFDIFDLSIYDKYQYKIYNMNGIEYKFDGLVTFSMYYNVAVIKLSDDVGLPIFDERLFFIDNIVGTKNFVFVPSITGNIQAGYIEETVEQDYGYIISNIVLSDVDRGSPLINSNGNVVAVNTRVNSGYSVHASVDAIKLSNIYYNTSYDSFSNIEYFRFIE